MIFTEFRFLFFFAAVFAVYWTLRRNRDRKIWLLLASYLFYAAWDWRFLSLILFSTLVDYEVGRRLGELEKPGPRRRWLLVSLCANLGLLGVFKYCNFFLDSGADLLAALGLPISAPSLAIVLPVGISFYTFQTMSYTIDVYRRAIRPTRSLLDVALFVGFFPQLVAGPIVRAARFLPQLLGPRRFGSVDGRSALLLFLSGYFKKACISDNVAPVVDAYFAAPEQYTAMAAWIAVLLYAVQIYCDFSGYSDMAIACAALLGYDLRLNFDYPYLATSITDFWRRWHISLSSWLRDYLYIPLGGNRGSRLFTFRNLMLTMALGGLWHGAAWNFVIWGVLHGLALGAHKAWKQRVPASSPAARVVATLGLPLTLYWVCLTWIFFRATGVAEALTTLEAFVLLRSPGTESYPPVLLGLIALLALLHWLSRQRRVQERWLTMPDWSFAAVYGAAAALAISLIHPSSQPFIYFQF